MMNCHEKKRDKAQSNTEFKMMTVLFSIRDIFKNPLDKIQKLELQEGYTVLDYGCGPGSYTMVAARIVGESGKIYAADIHPLAIEKVRKKALKLNLENIEGIITDCKTGIIDSNVDVAFLFDVFHDIIARDAVLKEIHRILKPQGKLAVDDHHLVEEEIISGIIKNGLFDYLKKKEKMYFFLKK